MIRGQKRPLNNETMKINKEAKFSIHNRFDIEVTDAETGDLKQKAYAENIILNKLWTRLLTPASYFNYILFGTGIGVPDPARDSLFSHLGYKTANGRTFNTDYSNGWFSFKRSCQLSETEYVGAQLSEIGIGYTAATNNLVTHALLKDMNGNTITITKTNIDIVNIYATVFVHWNPNGYLNGGIWFPHYNPSRWDVLAGDLTPFSLFTYLAGGESSPPTQVQMTYGDGARGECLSGYAAAYTASVAYDMGNKRITFTVPRVGAKIANTEKGLLGASLCKPTGSNWKSGSPELVAEFSIISPSSITGESVGTGDGLTQDFATVFPFVKSGAKIYVDGVEQTSGVSVDTKLPNSSDVSPYMRVIEAGLVNGRTTYGAIPYPGCEVILGSDLPAGQCIFENPFYEDYGIDKLTIRGVKVYTSEDLETWVYLEERSHTHPYNLTISIDSQYKQYRYWKLEGPNPFGSSGSMIAYTTCDALANYKNIHFDIPPSSGAVITADYDTDVVAKDENHVFDFSFEITLGEKTI